MSNISRIAIAGLALTWAWTGGCVVTAQPAGAYVEGPGVVVDAEPPAAQVEVQPVIPGPDYIWVPGYWNWGVNGYFWVGGRWGRPPHPGAVWVPHGWERRGGRWHLHGGHWR